MRADAAVVDFVEAIEHATVSPADRKDARSNLTADEIAALRARMGTVRLLTYRVDARAPTRASRRKVFAFAKAMGADTIVVPATTPLDGLDALADESA